MRKKIVAGNWKMHLSKEEAILLHREVEEIINTINSCEVYQFAPALYLDAILQNKVKVKIGGQNAHPAEKGAFTGEISMKQLQEIGADAVLVGHSERRELFGEKNEFLKEKVNTAITQGLTVFFCCGETIAERKANLQEEKIKNQLTESLFHLSAKDIAQVVIAYEPIWAIGTGETATPEQANAMHQYIRQILAERYTSEIADNISILYGGSCNPSNAQELFSQSDIDGGLIGGASLKSVDFGSIINIYK